MDNNPTEQQDDQPVFSSTQIVNTKSRTSGSYFTNVQNATLGQKISNWFAKFRRDSEARSEARSAAFKAKLAEKKREADIAAISINIPDNAASISNPAIVRSEAYAEQIAAQAEKKKSSRPALIALIIIVILLIVGIILAIIKPWEPEPAPVAPTPASVPSLTNKYEKPCQGNDATPACFKDILDTYKDGISEDNLLSAEEQQLRILTAVVYYQGNGDAKAAISLIKHIDEELLEETQLVELYDAARIAYFTIGDNEKGEEYHQKLYSLPQEVLDAFFNGG